MKKTALFIITMCFISISLLNAQFDKGKILLGVSSSSELSALMAEYYNANSNLFNLGFSTYKYKSDSDDGDSEKFRSFNISPRVGYFLVNNLSAGLNINFSVAGSGTGNDKNTEILLGIGPFVRYYLPGEKVSFFLEGGASFGSVKEKYINWNDEKVTDKQSINSFYGGVGLVLPIVDRVNLDLMGGYFSSTAKSKDDNPDNARLIFNTLGFKIGFLILIGADQ